jgi:hypothetical protein
MPIRPEFRRFYRGKAWQLVRERIRARALNSCEACGVRNHTRVYRRGGWWFDDVAHHWRGPDGSFTFPPRGLRRRFVRIVCTISHTNHTPGDDYDDNLRFLCQWCHLNHDRRMHLANSSNTRKTKKDAGRPLLQEAV